ncbi:RNAse P Rpr2/Rpp21/SNM1 subunit domain-containing protein [Schizophyllum amplum]|uniref:RNAse P Rpr2/Rpp21/SNM1 subunit domain-containing protein n=1 Tax=Schizophyllum amplum TaxID=97359 RepID=A0A550CZ98_9AGAR|nr:RNAse P Rpr2/Rpp21/SNM1 subunit domain-containing protein [Auriculariopsis ampla]
MDASSSHSAAPQQKPKQKASKQAATKTKADKVGGSGFGAVTNRDILQRMNFLYQSSVYLNTIFPPSHAINPAPPIQPIQQSASQPAKRKRRQATTVDLSREYVKTMKAVGRKSVMRIDPAVKRTICKAKNCDTVMIPGANVNVRVQSSNNHGHTLSFICPTCGRKRRIPAPSANTRSDEVTAAVVDADKQDVEMEDVQNAQRGDAAATMEGSSRHAGKLPLFADRTAGHVVLRGKDRVDASEDISSWAC